ncbi:DUF418 domain-containing protein, partial [Streptococcus suis]|uniref:DUF418 domain-containing protein n=1 Tax=Streptococcus suis TaxID=1307 RepID=UPI0037BD820F
GALAARARVLEEPERHLAALRAVAAGGLAAAVLGGLPLALVVAGVVTDPPVSLLPAVGAVHALGGYAGGVGYAALFGLLAARAVRGGRRP